MREFRIHSLQSTIGLATNPSGAFFHPRVAIVAFRLFVSWLLCQPRRSLVGFLGHLLVEIKELSSAPASSPCASWSYTGLLPSSFSVLHAFQHLCQSGLPGSRCLVHVGIGGQLHKRRSVVSIQHLQRLVCRVHPSQPCSDSSQLQLMLGCFTVKNGGLGESPLPSIIIAAMREASCVSVVWSNDVLNCEEAHLISKCRTPYTVCSTAFRLALLVRFLCCLTCLFFWWHPPPHISSAFTRKARRYAPLCSTSWNFGPIRS